jgi:hypothetical protein
MSVFASSVRAYPTMSYWRSVITWRIVSNRDVKEDRCLFLFL